MATKEQGGYLTSYINEAQRFEFKDTKGSIVDEILGDQLSFNYFAASDIKTYSHEAMATDIANFYTARWHDLSGTGNTITASFCIADSDLKNQMVTPLSIDASFKKTLFVKKDNYSHYPSQLATSFGAELLYSVKRSFLGDEHAHFVNVAELAEDVSPLVRAVRITRFIEKDIHDVSIGTLFLRNNYKVARAFGEHGENPPSVIACFNGKNVIRGVNGEAQEVSRDDLRKLGIGVSYKDAAEHAQMTVGLFGANIHLSLSKRLFPDYETRIVCEGSWITNDIVNVETQPLYKLN